MVGSPSDYEVIFNLAEGSYQPPMFFVVWITILGVICLIGVTTRRGMEQLLAGVALLAGLAFGLFSIFEHHRDYVRMRAELMSGGASVVGSATAFRDFRSLANVSR
jgi:hypothetical protein